MDDGQSLESLGDAAVFLGFDVSLVFEPHPTTVGICDMVEICRWM